MNMPNMRVFCSSYPCWCAGKVFAILLFALSLTSAASIVSVKNVNFLGPQLTPDVEDISRDGGYSVVVNGNIVWLYDDTECFDAAHTQLSFVSNTGAFGDRSNVSLAADFGVVDLGKDTNGKKKTAILAGTTVATGGWIPFQDDELHFNEEKKGQERVAIWPGTSPTSISTTQAFLFAPLVYVDYKPQDPSKEYQSRGMTLITIDAPASGPIAKREGDLAIAGTEVPFGGFSTLIGYRSTSETPDVKDRDVYLFGMTSHGLQLARVGVNNVRDFSKFKFYEPSKQDFVDKPPKVKLTDKKHIYLPGTFSSGNIFYSPYFATFVIVYFNKMGDSTFYLRYIDVTEPVREDAIWVKGGKNGNGIAAEDVEALVMYPWSAEEKLYSSPVMQGFNYAGMPHPEYFNRQYFAPTLYPPGTPDDRRINDWFGGSMIPETNAGSDGKHLLLSWTSQLKSDTESGIYQVQLAIVEFDDINAESNSPPPTASPTSTGKHGHKPVNTALNMIPKGAEGARHGAFVGFRLVPKTDILGELWALRGLGCVSAIASVITYWA